MALRRTLNSIGAALAGAALLLAGPAAANPIAPVSLLPALDVYIDALAAAHAAGVACAATWPASKADEAGWTKAKAIFVATLWASDFPIDFVRTATQRLDAPPPETKPDCAHPDAALVDDYAWPKVAGWVEVIDEGLKGMDLTVISNPVPAATWTTIQGMIAPVLPREKRLLDCIAVMSPETLPNSIHEWDAMIVELGGRLVEAGLPRDEIGATLSDAEANHLWQRAPAAGEAELRDSCKADVAVQTDINNFGLSGLGAEVEKLLPAPDSGT
jgi:hypothetical protein